MALAIKHNTQVNAGTYPDDPAFPIGTTEWNEDHQLTGTADIAQGGTGASDAATARANLGAEAAITAGTTAQYWRGDKSWRDFATDVRAAVLTGLSTATNAAVVATDTVLEAFGKLQAQITGYADTVRSWTKAQRGTPVGLTDAATVAVDLSLANNFTLAINGNRTLGAPTNVVAGQSGYVKITKTTNGQTLAYNTFWKFEGGTVPSLTTANTAVDMFFYTVDSSTEATCVLVKDRK